MKQAQFIRGIIPILGLALCTTPLWAQSPAETPVLTPAPAAAPAPVVPLAVAKMINSKGEAIGKAEFRQGPQGVLIDLMLSGMTPGAHAVHLHGAGVCDKEVQFSSAKGHVGDGAHGFLHAQGPHAGDLPNIVIGADGTGTAKFYTQAVRLVAPAEKKVTKFYNIILDNDGSALIVHEKQDDDITQSTGNSGPRVACGVVTLVTSKP